MPRTYLDVFAQLTNEALADAQKKGLPDFVEPVIVSYNRGMAHRSSAVMSLTWLHEPIAVLVAEADGIAVTTAMLNVLDALVALAIGAVLNRKRTRDEEIFSE